MYTPCQTRPVENVEMVYQYKIIIFSSLTKYKENLRNEYFQFVGVRGRGNRYFRNFAENFLKFVIFFVDFSIFSG